MLRVILSVLHARIKVINRIRSKLEIKNPRTSAKYQFVVKNQRDPRDYTDFHRVNAMNLMISVPIHSLSFKAVEAPKNPGLSFVGGRVRE
jgi:hypothetical protein